MKLRLTCRILNKLFTNGWYAFDDKINAHYPGAVIIIRVRKTRVIVREFQGIDVDSKLIFDAQYEAGQPPIKMAAIEIIREDQSENSALSEPIQ